MNGHASSSRAPADGDGDSDSDEFDPVSFQAELDASVNSSRSLVQSWLPSDLGNEWDDAFSAQKGAAGLQGLKDAMRPARLGLGAQPAAAHKQLAEDRKIKNRLLGKNRQSFGDEGANVKSQNGMMRTSHDDRDDDHDDDEEESRAGAIGKSRNKSKAAVSAGPKKDYINPFLLPKATLSDPAKSDVHVAANAGGKALFHELSPARKPAPDPLWSTSSQQTASTRKAPLVAAAAFYDSGAAAGPDAAPLEAGASGAQLTKNQRKKERQREKLAALKRQREDESRQEEEAELRKRSKTDGKGSRRGDDDASADPDDDVDRRDEENDSAGDVSMASLTAHSDNGPRPGQLQPSDVGEATASPAKRRKKKKKKAQAAGAGTATEEKPLLNLG
ncbi:hypothetical protein JCM3774_002576 [Rhodotorula dairenensis]